MCQNLLIGFIQKIPHNWYCIDHDKRLLLVSCVIQKSLSGCYFIRYSSYVGRNLDLFCSFLYQLKMGFCYLIIIYPQPFHNPMSIYKRSEEHTSELQSRSDLVCRLLLEKKKKMLIERVLLTLASRSSYKTRAI